jgi:hypothetical protein
MIEQIQNELEEIGPDLVPDPKTLAKVRAGRKPWGPALDREKDEIPGFTAFKFSSPEFYTSKKAKAAGLANDIPNLPLYYQLVNGVPTPLAFADVPKFGFGTTCRINFDVWPYAKGQFGINLRPREVLLLKVVELGRQAQGFGAFAEEPTETEAGTRGRDHGVQVEDKDEAPAF